MHMNNVSLSVTRIVRLVGEQLRAFLNRGSFSFKNHTDARSFNRINSLEPIAPQSALTASNRINSLASVAPQFFAQELRGFTQNPCICEVFPYTASAASRRTRRS